MSDVAPTGNPLPPKYPKYVLRVFTKGVKFPGVPSEGVPGKGSDTDKSTDALCSPTPVGRGVDPGGGKPPQYVLIPLWGVFSWVSLNVCHHDTDLGVRGERVNTVSWLQRRTG